MSSHGRAMSEPQDLPWRDSKRTQLCIYLDIVFVSPSRAAAGKGRCPANAWKRWGGSHGAATNASKPIGAGTGGTETQACLNAMGGLRGSQTMRAMATAGAALLPPCPSGAAAEGGSGATPSPSAWRTHSFIPQPLLLPLPLPLHLFHNRCCCCSVPCHGHKANKNQVTLRI